MRIQVSGAQ
ncbi:hypothetical protein EYF80_064064 [Liparis tanakae]|uniref:Uncharacterized protein n=1 Tax=Liparis tanakae TaxID=230148 RepID=A0A4Z2EB87_9TELE|nr:hypothetical protein EYF80_064064 [Liparis tanakae]